MPRFEFPDRLEDAEANEPELVLSATCAFPANAPVPAIDVIPGCPDAAIDVMPDWPEDKTVCVGGTEDTIPLDIIFDICIAICVPPID